MAFGLPVANNAAELREVGVGLRPKHNPKSPTKAAFKKPHAFLHQSSIDSDRYRKNTARSTPTSPSNPQEPVLEKGDMQA